jgi:hypothetical protein
VLANQKRLHMRRLGWFILAGCTLLALAIFYTKPADKGPPGEWVVRMYDVGDLVDMPIEQPPTALVVPASGINGRPPERKATNPEKESLNQLIALVRSGVDPGSWSWAESSVTPFGRRLVVVQTRRNQQAIAALLEELRAHPLRQIHIEMIWATLSSDELAKITVPGDLLVRQIDLTAIEKIPNSIAWRGQTLCRDGHNTKIICGKSQTILAGIDVGIDQTMGGFIGSTQQLLDGAVVYLLPSLNDDGSSVLLDLHSEVTRISPEKSPPIALPMPRSPGGASADTMKLDRLNLGVQSITSTVRVPTNSAVIVASTDDPDAKPADPRRLYLIARITVAKPSEK